MYGILLHVFSNLFSLKWYQSMRVICDLHSLIHSFMNMLTLLCKVASFSQLPIHLKILPTTWLLNLVYIFCYSNTFQWPSFHCGAVLSSSVLHRWIPLDFYKGATCISRGGTHPRHSSSLHLLWCITHRLLPTNHSCGQNSCSASLNIWQYVVLCAHVSVCLF